MGNGGGGGGGSNTTVASSSSEEETRRRHAKRKCANGSLLDVFSCFSSDLKSIGAFVTMSCSEAEMRFVGQASK
ncbi:unnamed protein product [Rotaria sp. Silwood2]|nr:unnamed protein product [Rotaria sp. Silwood2]